MATLKQKMAAMLMMGFDGTSYDELDTHFSQFLLEHGLGGVLLFTKNLKDIAAIKQLTTQLKQRAHGTLWIAIDDEGGSVNRFLHLGETLYQPLAAREVAVHYTPSLQSFHFENMAKRLKQLGFNLNFAPVVDLGIQPDSSVLVKNGRCFGASSDVVIKMAERFLNAFSKQSIRCCLKHFPGHGSAVGDTHADTVDVSETFSKEELAPYSALLSTFKNDFLPLVMTAHVINRQLSPDDLPATFSKNILTKFLRETLGFEGVIVSDDLQMSAISHLFTLEESLEKAINAGVDLLIFGNQLAKHLPETVLQAMEYLLETGKISMIQIDRAYERIQQMKQLS